MFFSKISAIATALAAGATLAAASPLEARQLGGCEGVVNVNCVVTATASGVPDTSLNSVGLDWAIIVGQNFASSLPESVTQKWTCGNGRFVANGPDANGVYTIEADAGNPELTAAQSSAVVQSVFFPGATFDGTTSVTWTVGSVACDA